MTLTQETRDAHKFVRRSARDVVSYLRKHENEKPLELIYNDKGSGYSITNISRDRLDVSARLTHVSDEGGREWEFSYGRGLWVYTPDKIETWKFVKVPERDDDKILIGAEMLPVLNKCAKSFGFRANLDYDGRLFGLHPSITFGGRFRNWSEVFKYLKVFDDLIDFRLKELE